MFNNQIVSSISLALPKTKVTNADIYNINPNVDPDKVLHKYGTETRFWCDPEESFFDLALNSIKNLELNKSKKKSIKFLVIVTQTSEFNLPGVGQKLSEEAGLNRDIYILEISQGCAGFVHALFVASFLCESLGSGIILCGDTYSKILNMQDTSTMPIFGDGVSSVLLESVNESFKRGINRAAFKFHSRGDLFNRLIAGEKNKPDQSCRNELYMDGPGVFNFVTKDVSNLLYDLDLDLYERVYIHQASKFTFNEFIKKNKISKDKCPINLHLYGNLTSASIPSLWMDEIKNQKENQRLLFVGFGVGLSAGVGEYVT